MITKYTFSHAARAYMQMRLSSGGALEQLLSEKITAEEGHAFSFLPSRFCGDTSLECFQTDSLVGVTSHERSRISVLEAEFIAGFLQSHPQAVLIVRIARPQMKTYSPYPNTTTLQSPDGRTSYNLLFLSGATRATVADLFSGLQWRPLACFLTHVPATLTASAATRELDAELTSSLATRCQHIVLSAFDHYGLLIWSSTADNQSPSLTPPTEAKSSPVRLDLDQSTVYYFHQLLCNTLYRSWVQPSSRSMYERGRFWCISPVSPPPFFAAKLGGSFRYLFPQVTQFGLQKVRRSIFEVLSAYLDKDSHAFLLGPGYLVWSSDLDPIRPGRSANGAHRVLVHTGYTYKRTNDTMALSYVFHAVSSGIDAVRCMEQTWQRPPGDPYCAAIVEAPETPFLSIAETRALTMHELEAILTPATKCLVVGGFQNELPLLWTAGTFGDITS